MQGSGSCRLKGLEKLGDETKFTDGWLSEKIYDAILAGDPLTCSMIHLRTVYTGLKLSGVVSTGVGGVLVTVGWFLQAHVCALEGDIYVPDTDAFPVKRPSTITNQVAFHLPIILAAHDASDSVGTFQLPSEQT